MTLLSIDGSTKSTGVAIFQDGKLIKYQCLTATSTNVLNRIDKITKELESIIKEYNPDRIVMEEILPEDVKHNQSVFKALMYLQGNVAIMLNSHKKKIDKFYVASEWRAAVGIKTGRYNKRETLKANSITLIKNTYSIDVNDDISDAICIGLADISKNKTDEINWG